MNHPFGRAVEARDIDAIRPLLCEDVVFHSPIVYDAYKGRDVVVRLLLAVEQVFDDFHYLREIASADGSDHALVFAARVGDREIEGCDFLHTDEQGLIDEFTVMVRPLSGAMALAEAMKRQLDLAQTEPPPQA